MTSTPGQEGGTPPDLLRLRRRLPLLVTLVGAAVLAVVAGAALTSSDDPPAGSSDVTDPARFDIPALEGGGRVRLADFEGRPVVVNFFASWCAPCRKELPDLAGAARQLAGRVAFVAVNSKELSAAEGIDLARSAGLGEAGVALGRDVGGPGGSALHDAFKARNAMPLNAFYDAAGELVLVVPGQLTPETLGERLRELFGVTL